MYLKKENFAYYSLGPPPHERMTETNPQKRVRMSVVFSARAMEEWAVS